MSTDVICALWFVPADREFGCDWVRYTKLVKQFSDTVGTVDLVGI